MKKHHHITGNMAIEALNTAREKEKGISVSAYVHIHILNRPSKNIVIEAFTVPRPTALGPPDIQKYKVENAR